MTPPIRMVSVPEDVATEAVNCMARAYERVHSFPRVSDTELANRIGAAKEALRIALTAAPVREEGGAVSGKALTPRQLEAVEEALIFRLAGDTSDSDIPADVYDRALGKISGLSGKLLATREEAPAEAGE